ncbi:hypothetical protein CHARACLAT_032784 [Characodon lateralis]|uniref:Uncharacterized protein n=1 Tax=Characodon lateralis TaxID=208331 RepID=A0ABU7DXP5_9TELE|nr:hypothetical protein [Characodon lateralis]
MKMSSCAADPRGAHGVNEQGAGGSDRRDGMEGGGGWCCGSLVSGCFHGRTAQESKAGARSRETLIKNKLGPPISSSFTGS